MRVAYFILAMYLLLPWAGLYTISDSILSVYNLSIASVYELRTAYPLYLACFTAAFVLPLYLRGRTRGATVKLVFSPTQLKQQRLYITVFLALSALIVFILVGRHILAGTTHRGEVRVSFGGVGFLYRTLSQFWVPLALAVSGTLYAKGKSDGVPYNFPLIHLLLTLAILVMTGYKSVIVVGVLPFLFCVVPVLKLRTQMLLGLALIATLIVYSSFSMNMNDVFLASNYLFIRGTEGTSWGLIASWDLFEYPNPSAWMTLVPVFGPQITAWILDIPRGSTEYLMLGSGQYVTYLVHPDPSMVLAGETNLTITLAGEAVFLLGRSLFWLVAFPVGFVTGVLYNSLRSAIQNNDVIWAPMLGIIVTNIILPLLNSGGLISLFSVFNIFYVLVSALFLKSLMALVGPPQLSSLYLQRRRFEL